MKIVKGIVCFYILLGLSLSALGSDGELDARSLVARKVAGNIEFTAEEWVNAEQIELVLSGSGAKADPRTQVRVLYNEAAFFLLVNCESNETFDRVSRPHNDNAIFLQDHMEFFISPGVSDAIYYHFAVDRSGNVFASERRRDGGNERRTAWESGWSSEVKQTANGWRLWVRIPFSDLEVTAPDDGSLWRFKAGRYSRNIAISMWPANPQTGFHNADADGQLYFNTTNLLLNGDFSVGEYLRSDLPPTWTASLTSSEVDHVLQGEVTITTDDEGIQALKIEKFPDGLWWPQVWHWGTPMEAGAEYEYSLLLKGEWSELNMRMLTQLTGSGIRERMRIHSTVHPTDEYQWFHYRFSVPLAAGSIGLGISSSAGISGEVFVREARLRQVLSGSTGGPSAIQMPDFSEDVAPTHGLRAWDERAGLKPWDIFWEEDYLRANRLIFHDLEYGTEIWMLDDSPASDPAITASVWPAWNADASQIMLWSGKRYAEGEHEHSVWTFDADFSRLTPEPYGKRIVLWSRSDPDLYFAHYPGRIERIDRVKNERRILAEWEPTRGERSYGMTADGSAVFVIEHDGGLWVPYDLDRLETPVPALRVMDCYGLAPDRRTLLPSGAVSIQTEQWGPLLRIVTGTTICTETGTMQKIAAPISGNEHYLKAFATANVSFPDDVTVPDTSDIDELFELYRYYPSSSHGHVSYSPDREYTAWDGSQASFYRERDGGYQHQINSSPNGANYHVHWYKHPRFFISWIRGYTASYGRPDHGNLIGQYFTDGTWQPVVDIKSRPNAFYEGGDFSMLSPDATKIHYGSSMTGKLKNYIAVLARPRPPLSLEWALDEDGVILSWQPAAFSRETKGYNIYRSDYSGNGYVLLNRELLLKPHYLDGDVKQGQEYFYVVTAVEHSGLESGYSQELARVAIDAQGARESSLVLYFEAEEFLFGLDTESRPGFSIGRDRHAASDWYYIYPTPGGDSPSIELSLSVEHDDRYWVWLRVRNAGSTDGRLQVDVNGKELGSLTVDRQDWQWQRVSVHPVSLAAGEFSLQMSTRDRSVQIDLVALSTDPDWQPPIAGRPEHSEPLPAVQGLRAQSLDGFATNVFWDPVDSAYFSHYNVYAGKGVLPEIDQRYRIGSPTVASFIDWGLVAGEDYYYIVTAVDRRGNESLASMPVQVSIATPDWTPRDYQLAFVEGDQSITAEVGTAHGTLADQYVLFPETEQSQNTPRPEIRWEVTLAEEGDYYLWLRYLPRGAASIRASAKNQNVQVLIDDQEVLRYTGRTDLSAPDSLLTAGSPIADRLWTWYWPGNVDLIPIRLSAGKHNIVLRNLTREIRYDVLVITNKPWFNPADGRLFQRP